MTNRMKTACLFGGQGSQYIGMGQEFYEADEDCRRLFTIASEVMGYDMAELCFYGEEETFQHEIYSLPSMLTIDLCAFTLAVKRGFSFQAVAGFSLGEYAALAAAQVVSVRNSFGLVKRLVEASHSVLREGSYSMAAVNLPAEMCAMMCSHIHSGYVQVANYSSKKQVTIAGNRKGLEAFSQIANEFGAKVMPIRVNRPFHCKLMEPAAAVYKEEIQSVPFADPIIPVYMNVTGEMETKADQIKVNIVQQLYSPVLWVHTLENMHLAGVERYVECGLRSVLCRMVRDTLGITREQTVFLRTPEAPASKQSVGGGSSRTG
ncbi:ACP S-malonyltransferase [Paenibacillus thiaminolyticus]|uniref:Malonyl CoA-acyl carrier protein transacylase n=1 Tax=Paenibacillus thiaminolyticus TaxID=49283 RepID=A0AAP9J3F0_PANTH|nr:ACP S-malonyltransferase [Paenibacillus thiaminolyticus]MCY9534499.1 ACP S-malonyltransferase [Paenibacillus thiaminolyticus]MCY9601309.1 ACP S-malonyltransferase [Paenibacillus thiaminolyticus]MCY9606461.1 ACP S-malonyltransferase [Paenibacillus thiaminolyticus]MCY9614061.1 ACP S-malonyltransferase [Paenibacillus thiaminolyticus]MCY9618598.1 ACP S-malonyltransferase [Paenibacillus thiaminolyticus]